MTPSIVDLKPYYGLLQVSGPEAASFLQGQLSCDMEKISESEFGLGAHCNLKGRIRALYKIVQKEEGFYLEAPKSLLNYAASELAKYAKFSKVSIEEKIDWDILGIIGIKDLAAFFAEHNISLGPNIHIIKMPYSQDRYQLIGKEEALQPLWDVLKELSKNSLNIKDNTKSRLNFEHWKLMDIRAGLPEIWPELKEQILPHHINLPKLKAVSFSKGCYCGQEIVARMEHLGKIKKRMLRGRIINFNDNKANENINPIHMNLLSSNIVPGTLLLVDKSEIGMVITSAIVDSENHAEKDLEILFECSAMFLAEHNNPTEICIQLKNAQEEQEVSPVRYSLNLEYI